MPPKGIQWFAEYIGATNELRFTLVNLTSYAQQGRTARDIAAETTHNQAPIRDAHVNGDPAAVIESLDKDSASHGAWIYWQAGDSLLALGSTDLTSAEVEALATRVATVTENEWAAAATAAANEHGNP